MRKIIIIAFLILFAALVGILQIQRSKVDVDATAKTTKVGVLLSGTRNDENYCQAHYEAMEAIKEELNLDIVYREVVPEDCHRDIVRLVRDEGCRIIVGVSYHFGKSLDKAAAEYPDIYFFHASGTSSRHNLASFFGRMYQARYLSGIVAGMTTKTGEIGYVAAFPISEVIRGINAFTLGVRSVRPNAVVHVRYCSSWTEDAPAGRTCRELVDRFPIDVVAMHTNSNEPNRVADERGIMSIGCNLDNADNFSDKYLTACVWKWDAYYRKQILNCLQGKFHGRRDWIDMEKDIVGLSEFSGQVSRETVEAVDAAKEKFRGSFDVFYGPIRDNTGRLRVAPGESMTDAEMLNAFDWYVEGVAIEGQGVGGL